MATESVCTSPSAKQLIDLEEWILLKPLFITTSHSFCTYFNHWSLAYA
jgi:hypothetical protein